MKSEIETRSFSDVLEIRNGKDQKKVQSPDGAYPIYGSGGEMGRASAYLCPAETIILGRKGSINSPIFVREPFWNVDTAFGLIANRNILDPVYLFHFCKSFDFSKLNTTVTIPSLTKANLLKVRLPVPSMETQKSIAARLGKVCDLIDKRQAQLAQLDTLAKSLFVEMFGDPVDNPMRWETKPILSLGECRNGLNFAPNESGFSIPCIGVSDFKDRAIITREIPLQEVSLAGKPAESQLLRDGDFLFVRSNGNKALVGRCVLVLRDGAMTTFSGFCIRFRLHSHMPIAPRYLLHVFRSDSIRRKLAGRGANIQNMSQKTLEPLSIPVPPLSLQRTFVERIEAIDKSKFAILRWLSYFDREAATKSARRGLSPAPWRDCD